MCTMYGLFIALHLSCTTESTFSTLDGARREPRECKGASFATRPSSVGAQRCMALDLHGGDTCFSRPSRVQRRKSPLDPRACKGAWPSTSMEWRGHVFNNVLNGKMSKHSALKLNVRWWSLNGSVPSRMLHAAYPCYRVRSACPDGGRPAPPCSPAEPPRTAASPPLADPWPAGAGPCC